MSNENAPYRPAIHVRLYLWMGLLLASVIPAALLAFALAGPDAPVEEVTVFAVSLLIFQALFWYARRRCSTADLSAWEGLTYITAYMTIGISTSSLFVAVPCAAIGVLGMIGIALLTLFDPDPAGAQKRFRSMVAWFSRHRMYQ